MDTQTALQKAGEILQPFAAEVKTPEANRADYMMPVQNLIPAVQALVDARWGYLAAITGLDCPAPAVAEGQAAEGAVEVLYHFCEGAAIATLRLKLPYSEAVVPTVCGMLPAATLYERELIEMLGVTVVDTPNTDHLILPDDWPAGVYPLRKSFTGLDSEKG